MRFCSARYVVFDNVKFNPIVSKEYQVTIQACLEQKQIPFHIIDEIQNHYRKQEGWTLLSDMSSYLGEYCAIIINGFTQDKWRFSIQTSLDILLQNHKEASYLVHDSLISFKLVNRRLYIKEKKLYFPTFGDLLRGS